MMPHAEETDGLNKYATTDQSLQTQRLMGRIDMVHISMIETFCG